MSDSPQKPDAEVQADAARYRWLFADDALEEFKRACESGGDAPLSERTDILHGLLGFVTERRALSAAIDAAMQATSPTPTAPPGPLL
jgi:hypothetical protein